MLLVSLYIKKKIKNRTNTKEIIGKKRTLNCPKFETAGDRVSILPSDSIVPILPILESLEDYMTVKVEIRVNGNLELETKTDHLNVSRLAKEYLEYYPNAVITIRKG